MPHRILITGSAGTIGKPVTQLLRDAGHFVRGLDLAPSPLANESLTGNITDSALLHTATHSIDTIIHLAAALEWLDFENDQIPSNILAPFRLFEAAKKHQVQRILLASTVQVGGGKKQPDNLRRVADGTHPHNTYGCTKVFLEELGKMYASNEKMSVLAARIAWVPRSAKETADSSPRARKSYYLSHDDIARFFRAAVEATPTQLPPGSFHAAYVASKNSEPIMDLSDAQTLLNWHPQNTFPQGLPPEWIAALQNQQPNPT